MVRGIPEQNRLPPLDQDSGTGVGFSGDLEKYDSEIVKNDSGMIPVSLTLPRAPPTPGLLSGMFLANIQGRGGRFGSR